jgi:hypothetical protein
MPGDFSNRNGNMNVRPTAPEALSDEQLMHEAQSGDGDAFTVLFDRYGSLPLAFSFTGNSFTVGVTFTLKQTSLRRYSILKP